jgi:hypothetical protein
LLDWLLLACGMTRSSPASSCRSAFISFPYTVAERGA